MKEEWRCAQRDSGEGYVTMAGMFLMPLWCADNWATPLKACCNGSLLAFTYKGDHIAGSTTTNGFLYGSSVYPLLWKNVTCVGNESKLQECKMVGFWSLDRCNGSGVRCNPRKDA